MKTKDLKDQLNKLSRAELVKEASSLRQEALQLRIEQTGGTLANPARRQTIRKTIARIETLLNSSAK